MPSAKTEGALPPEYHSDTHAWSAYTEAMMDAGVIRGGNALKSGFKELGGYYIIDPPDLDAALQWPARSPAASYSAVEVRAYHVGLSRLGAALPWSSIAAEARRAYGRLVALLAARSGDLASAEDASGDALVAALERWPIDGAPANPRLGR